MSAPRILQPAAQSAPAARPDESGEATRWIGKPIDRLDGRAKVTGTAAFSAEYPLAGLAHAALAYSTIAKGRITGMDTADAQAAPGVLAVLTHLSAPPMKEAPPFNPAAGMGASATTAHLLNTDQIFWNGQPVAVVVADTLDRAEHAASLVRVAYAPDPITVSFSAGKAGAKTPDSIMGEDTTVRRGDAEAVLAAAAFKTDHTYTTPRHNHNALEPHATTAVWDGDQLTVWDASQFVAGCASTLAALFDLKPENVRVLAPYVGGGFGGKGLLWGNAQLCVLAAKVVDRPVRLALTREGVFRIVGGRTPSEQRVALAADKDGALTALIHTGVTATSTTNDFPEQFSFPARHLYASQTMLLTQTVMHLDTVPNTFMRAPGESIGTFALESALDELSYELGLDPIELRRRSEPATDPTKGTPFSSRRLHDAYALGAEKFGWRDRPAAPRSQRDGAWWVGQGVATAFYPAYRFPAAARVRLSADGTAVVQCGAQEMGMGTATVQTQHAAELLGLSMAKVRFEYGDTDLPAAPVAGGSNQTLSVALAVQQACEKLHRDLLAQAALDGTGPLAGARYEDVTARDGGLFRRDRPGVGEPYPLLMARLRRDSVEADAQSGPPEEMTRYSMGSYGAQFCEARVHARTGETRIARWVGAFDCGRILNPKTARSQFLGGIIMGLGAALTEETLFDERTGRIANPSLAEYHVPVHADVPPIEAYWLDTPDPQTPLGARGIGEIGITGVAAAVANAVYHATGKRVRDLPITLDKLL